MCPRHVQWCEETAWDREESAGKIKGFDMWNSSQQENIKVCMRLYFFLYRCLRRVWLTLSSRVCLECLSIPILERGDRKKGFKLNFWRELVEQGKEFMLPIKLIVSKSPSHVWVSVIPIKCLAICSNWNWTSELLITLLVTVYLSSVVRML